MAIKLEGYLSEIEHLEGELTIPKIIDSGGGGSVNLQEKSVSYTPTESAQSEMVTASPGYDGLSSVNVTVGAIPSQYIVPTGAKSITQNGQGIDVASYATANVNVPNSYSASDEGKVVSNGALVAQTSDTVTENDTYDTTLINSLTVNVQGGGGAGAVVQDQDGYLVLSPDAGGGGGATGTFTPASDTTSYIVDTGIDFTQFAFAATIDIGGSGKRSVRTGFCDFAVTNYVLCYFTTNNSGSGIASDSYSSSSGYFTKNGTSITISKSGTYMLSGVTYRWIAT